jgi:DNA-binding CsgD family transcriptional regulator/uncharacterized membrane protein YhaH (DUF805 family)
MNLEITSFFALNLAIGPLLVFWAWKLASRHPYRFLQPFKFYQLTWILYGILFFVGQFALRQVPGIDPVDRFMVFQVFALLPEPAWSLSMYLFLVWVFELALLSFPRRLFWIFWAVQLLMIAISIVNTAVVFPGDRFELGLLIGRVLDWIFYGQLVLLPVALLLMARRIHDPVRRRLAERLGWIYLAVNLVPAVAVLSTRAFVGGADSFLYVQSLVFLGINIPPLAILHHFLGRYPLVRPVEAAPDAVEQIVRHVDLNQREREIVPLVAKGLTNDEIAAELFISTKTVKNNISSIYRKTGLRNRVELANLLGGHEGL